MPLSSLAHKERVQCLVDLVCDLSKVTDPNEVLRIFATGMSQLRSPRGYLAISTRNLPRGQYKITRFINEIGPDMDLEKQSLNPWAHWGDLPTYDGGFLGKIISDNKPVLINGFKIENDPVLGSQLADYQSLMAIPLYDNGEPLNWSIILKREPDGFKEKELEEVILRNNLVGQTVKHVLVEQRLRQANELIQSEVERIARIQRGLMPKALPDVPKLTLAASTQSYGIAGGDFYDVMNFGDQANRAKGPFGLVIADASGHGPSATTVIAMTHAILRAFPNQLKKPSELLSYANQYLCENRIEGSFVTAFLALFDPTNNTLTYARAGHPPPLLKSPNQTDVQRLDKVGTLPLGIKTDIDFEDATLELQAGQSLLLYTDGIFEAQNPQGEIFGIKGVQRAMSMCVGEPQCTVSTLMNQLRLHEAGAKPTDDQTLLVAQFQGPADQPICCALNPQANQ